MADDLVPSSESDSMSGARPFERTFTVLVALAAVFAATAGYLSAEAQNAELDAKTEGLALVTEANRANADGNLILQADHALFLQFQIALDEGNIELATDLLNQTTGVQEGFFDITLTPQSPYLTFDEAWDAMEAFIFQEYTDKWAAAEQAFSLSQEEAEKGLNHLSITVAMALATMVGTVGMSARGFATRRALLVVMAALIAFGIVRFFT